MYQVVLSPGVEKFLDRIHKSDRRLFRRLIKALDGLTQNPYVAKSLVAGLAQYYSYRVRDYRIIFEIDRSKSAVYVEKIAHRSVAYK
ncbi:MAG: type II toxin-antitoxin system RelE/ParE family toxin [Dehalococcoidia bacterium]|nr:type II toxin-antitoxin system RelE/ParE family toxin [Dehalococcoidia bacterium]